ncbi:MAG: hypothetical protein AAF581_12715 [Planctomycetota bacterium]
MAPTSRNRRHLFLGILVFGLLLAGSLFERCRAQTFCNLIADPSVGNCVDELFIHAGESPFALTFIEPDTLVAVDLFTANFYKYDGAGVATQFATPLGGGQHTGLAYHPAEMALYWIIDTGTGQQLVKSDTNGVHLATMALTGTPGGLIGDITWSPASATFWGVDIENDIVFEFEVLAGPPMTAAATGNTFPHPGVTQFGGGAYGTGITSVPDNVGGGSIIFDIPAGAPTDLRASRLVRTNDAGSDRGVGYDFDGPNGLGGWITGIAFQPSTSGGPFEFIANTTDNRISRTIATELTGFLPKVVEFTCSSDADGNVTLSWTNLANYSQLEIFRDGVSIVSDTGGPLSTLGAQTFTDIPPDPGALLYEIATASAAMLPTTGNATCTVNVGRGRLVNFTTLPTGSNPLAMTIAESIGFVFVADLDTGMTNRYDKALAFVDTIASPFGTNITPGLTWRPGATMAEPGSLFWFDADNGMLLETDVNGLNPGTAVALTSPANGAIGDITYAAATDTFWGVDLTMDVYFEFLDDGSVTGNEIAFDEFGLGAMGWGNGVTAVGANAALDAPVGAFATGFPDQVGRVATDTGMAVGEAYSLVPATGSAFVNGIAYTADGSDGNPSEYVVGNDTGVVYELSLKLPGIAFSRGDFDQDGTIVFVDAFNIIQAVFGIIPQSDCLDAQDANDDGMINFVDGTFLLNHIFNIGNNPPPAPFGVCGLDPTDDALDCVSFEPSACP